MGADTEQMCRYQGLYTLGGYFGALGSRATVMRPLGVYTLRGYPLWVYNLGGYILGFRSSGYRFWIWSRTHWDLHYGWLHFWGLHFRKLHCGGLDVQATDFGSSRAVTGDLQGTLWGSTL